MIFENICRNWINRNKIRAIIIDIHKKRLLFFFVVGVMGVGWESVLLVATDCLGCVVWGLHRYFSKMMDGINSLFIFSIF